MARFYQSQFYTRKLYCVIDLQLRTMNTCSMIVGDKIGEKVTPLNTQLYLVTGPKNINTGPLRGPPLSYNVYMFSLFHFWTVTAPNIIKPGVPTTSFQCWPRVFKDLVQGSCWCRDPSCLLKDVSPSSYRDSFTRVSFTFLEYPYPMQCAYCLATRPERWDSNNWVI